MIKKNVSKVILPMIAVAAVSSTSLQASAVEARVEAGVLSCIVEGGTGFIVGSKKEMSCSYKGLDGFTETYTGNVKKFGIDIGKTKRTTIKWAVFAPTTELESGALEGNYAGISAEATVGVGVGANALVGGLDKSIALQPFSGQVQEGLNIAGGIGTMTLRN